MNIHTSVFSPADRMTKTFYDKVRKEITPTSTVSVYPLLALTWSLNERKYAIQKMNGHSERNFTNDYDIIITKKGTRRPENFLNEYTLFAEDHPSSLTAYKRKKNIHKTLFLVKKCKNIQSNCEKIPLFSFNYKDLQTHHKLILSVSGTFELDTAFNSIRVDFETENKGEKVIFESLNQRWLEGENQASFFMRMNHLLVGKRNRDENISIYISNPKRSLITFKNGKTEVYELNK